MPTSDIEERQGEEEKEEEKLEKEAEEEEEEEKEKNIVKINFLGINCAKKICSLGEKKIELKLWAYFPLL